jgi:hypothetical protein
MDLDAIRAISLEQWFQSLPKMSMATDLVRESAKLLALAGTCYPHKSGRGDLREEVFRDFLDRRLPKTVAATKGHIADSDGQVTSEFDVVLYDPLVRLLVADGSEATKVLPVESVRAVIEIRSDLDRRAIEDCGAKMAELAKLKRYHRPTHLSHLLDVVDSSWRDGYGATANCTAALPILCHLVGYSGNSADAAQATLHETYPIIEGVLRIGEYYIFRGGDGRFTVSQSFHLSLGMMLNCLAEHLLNFASYSVFTIPDLSRYSRLSTSLMPSDQA